MALLDGVCIIQSFASTTGVHSSVRAANILSNYGTTNTGLESVVAQFVQKGLCELLMNTGLESVVAQFVQKGS